jgi:lysozyme|tara:strand:+ start:125 stop:568 length:444 start_codon:yes stop_codon:yes gene_type:complete
VRTSGQGVALIKKFEGCELKAYQCSANVWTIGYGHTRGVKEGDEISADKAEYILLEDLIEFEKYVDQLVTVSLNQDQFDALVAWTFNLGPTNLKESTMLLRLNEAQYDDVPAQMARWNRSGGEVLEGLNRRRKAEGLLFQGLDWQDV